MSENDLRVTVTSLVARDFIIDDDVDPLVVLEETEDVHTMFSQVMEHRWINPTCHTCSFKVTDFPIRILFWIKTPSDIGVISSKNTQSPYEPAVSNCTLDNIICFCTVINELWSFLSGYLVES